MLIGPRAAGLTNKDDGPGRTRPQPHRTTLLTDADLFAGLGMIAERLSFLLSTRAHHANGPSGIWNAFLIYI
jgi:hypothetical protein